MQPFWRVLISILALLAAFNCTATSSDDDDNDDAADDDNEASDDDATDDDDDDSEAVSVAPIDPTLLFDDAPVLSNGYWDPPQTALGEFPGYDPLMYYSTLCWSVCDECNNLLPDGEVFFYQPGTTIIDDDETSWSELHDPPAVDLADVDDCAQPVEVCLTVLFAPEFAPGSPGTYCVRMEATDTDGNFSNLLPESCVTHNP
ncbi:MAG TPA: hypothetical protein PKW95_23580 [bacterium]|nr:hypothetical protein [bacterium]